MNLDGALHCPHDLTHIQDFRDDLPTLLGSTDNVNETEAGAQKIQKNEPMISVFEVIYLMLRCKYSVYLNLKLCLSSILKSRKGGTD